MTSSANVEKPISHVIYIYHHIVYFHQHGCRCMTEYKLGSQADMNSSRWRSKYAVSVCVECHNEVVTLGDLCMLELRRGGGVSPEIQSARSTS